MSFAHSGLSDGRDAGRLSGTLSLVDDERYPSDLERLEDNIKSEILAVSAMRRLDLDDSTVDHLAAAIVVNVDYGFNVLWAPKWVKTGEPHQWIEGAGSDSARRFIECVDCKRITAHATQDEADAWWVDHCAQNHG